MVKTEVTKKIPVTVLTGFLGSGKTTLLNRILNDNTHGMKFAVIENEFGDVGIDDKALSQNVDEELIEVMNGCICCTVRGDLVKALKSLYKRVESFDGVIIETTGLADPAPVCQTFFLNDEINTMYALDSVITVVDAVYILDRFAEEKPEGTENEAVEQVVFADKILLNKTDLVTEEARLVNIEKELRWFNPTAVIQRTKHSDINPKDMLNIQAFSLDRVLDFDPEFLKYDDEHQQEHEHEHNHECGHDCDHDHKNDHKHEHDHGHEQEPEHKHKHDHSVKSLGVKFEGSVNMTMLETWIQHLITKEGANLYRYKGIMSVKGMDNKFIFQGVGMLFSGGFSDVKWKEEEKRETRFVFIGKNLDIDFYRRGFMACRANQPLRFPVGSMVKANVGEFKLGKVLKHWDEGNAYRVEIQDKGRTNVWAPIDIDNYIRAV